jgi:hypothetical protein
MKSSEILNQVKTLLGVEIKLEKMKLENGTILEAESFASGNEVFIVTEDEKVALPIGDYLLEDGNTLIVEEEGLIKEIKSSEDTKDDSEKEDSEKEEVDAAEDDSEKDEIIYATKEELENVVKMIEEMKSLIKAEAKKEAVEELSKEYSFTEDVAPELSKELSAPAAKPFNTNAEISKREVQFKVASKRKMSTLDRVLNKLNKY